MCHIGLLALMVEFPVISCTHVVDKKSGGQAVGRCPLPRAHPVTDLSQNVQYLVCSGHTPGPGRTTWGIFLRARLGHPSPHTSLSVSAE